jgi:hypothetical protein
MLEDILFYSILSYVEQSQCRITHKKERKRRESDLLYRRKLEKERFTRSIEKDRKSKKIGQIVRER